MHGRVDPTTALGEEDVPPVGRDGHGLRVGSELGLVVREVLQDERGEVAILPEREQVLLVQGVQVALTRGARALLVGCLCLSKSRNGPRSIRQ